jgi:hypothetical protein
MLVKCPICGKEGSLQQRYRSVRIAHYKGYHGKTRTLEWHSTTIQNVLLVNKNRIKLNEDGKLELFTTLFTETMEKQHCLPKRKIMSLAPKPG